VKEQRDNLLRRAFFDETTLVTIISHLGDAYWAAGDRETAIKRWEESALIADTFSIRDLPFTIPEVLSDQYTAEAHATRAKLNAATADQDPLSLETDTNSSKNTNPSNK